MFYSGRDIFNRAFCFAWDNRGSIEHYRKDKKMTEVWVSIITGALTLIGVVVSNIGSNRKMEHQLEVSMAVTNTKLEDLTKQVEKHNQVIERTFKLEQAVEDLQRRD